VGGSETKSTTLAEADRSVRAVLAEQISDLRLRGEPSGSPSADQTESLRPNRRFARGREEVFE